MRVAVTSLTSVATLVTAAAAANAANLTMAIIDYDDGSSGGAACPDVDESPIADHFIANPLPPGAVLVRVRAAVWANADDGLAVYLNDQLIGSLPAGSAPKCDSPDILLSSPQFIDGFPGYEYGGEENRIRIVVAEGVAEVNQVQLHLTYRLCGDGLDELGEICDDGNLDFCDMCDPTCTLPAFTCDDGNPCTTDSVSPPPASAGGRPGAAARRLLTVLVGDLFSQRFARDPVGAEADPGHDLEPADPAIDDVGPHAGCLAVGPSPHGEHASAGPPTDVGVVEGLDGPARGLFGGGRPGRRSRVLAGRAGTGSASIGGARVRGGLVCGRPVPEVRVRGDRVRGPRRGVVRWRSRCG